VNQVATAAAQTNASEAAGAFEKEPREESDWFGDYEAEGGGHDENGSQDQDAWMQKVLNSFGGSGEGGGGSLDNATLQNVSYPHAYPLCNVNQRASPRCLHPVDMLVEAGLRCGDARSTYTHTGTCWGRV